MWSGQQDSNLRPSAPKADALPDCAMPRRDAHVIHLGAGPLQKAVGGGQVDEDFWKCGAGASGARNLAGMGSRSISDGKQLKALGAENDA